MADPQLDARSALNLRLVLALGGGLLCLVLGVFLLQVSVPLGIALLVLGVVGLTDAAVIQRRRRARAAAHGGSAHGHDSLFE